MWSSSSPTLGTQRLADGGHVCWVLEMTHARKSAHSLPRPNSPHCPSVLQRCRQNHHCLIVPYSGDFSGTYSKGLISRRKFPLALDCSDATRTMLRELHMEISDPESEQQALAQCSRYHFHLLVVNRKCQHSCTDLVHGMGEWYRI